MQFKALFSAVIALSVANAAYVPSEPWSTLTPSATLAGGTTSFSGTFGIAIETIASSAVTSSAVAKKVQNKAEVVSQIGDGQIQGATSTEQITVVSQIGDGQIQAPTTVSVAVVSQIGDGQVQAPTSTVAPTTVSVAVVSQIGDGQIQAPTSTEITKSTDVVSQIGDGQVQAPTSTGTTKSTDVVSQIGDGQVQATVESSTFIKTITSTETGVTQIGDGQVQVTRTLTSTETGATQIADGQVQATESASSESDSTSESTGITLTSCLSDDSLALNLDNGILTDAKGRIGSIVANRQFQFDGPPPQAGAIYAAGWSISEDGYLAIGDNTTFYQCLSGSFYNLYDTDIGTVCYPVHLAVVDLVKC